MSDRPVTILIVADDEARARVLEEGLACGRSRVHVVAPGPTLLERIAAFGADAVLIAPSDTSREALDPFFAVARSAQRPIAMFVDRAASDTVGAAVEAGVAAFVVDGLKKERVPAIVDLAVSRFHAQERLRAELNEARVALENRKLIERAKAILMRRNGLSEEEAYALLRRGAMNQNRKIVDLARSLIAAAELLEPGGE